MAFIDDIKRTYMQGSMLMRLVFINIGVFLVLHLAVFGAMLFKVPGDEVLQSKIAKMIVKLFTCSVKYVAQRGNFSAKTLDVTSHEMKQVQTQIHREIEKYKLVGGVG